MNPISSEELAAMIAALESQPHLSMKEEKYLAVMKAHEQLLEPIVLPGAFSVGDNEDDPDYHNTRCYEADEVREAITEHGLSWIEE